MNFSTPQLIELYHRMIDKVRGWGRMAPLLIILFIMGCIFWLPSGVINLREQEMIFPLIGIGLFLAGAIFFWVNKAAGAVLAFIIVYTLVTFTPDGYRFFFMIGMFACMYLVISMAYEAIENRKTLIFNLLCIIALLNVLWLVLQHNGVYIFFKPRFEALETGFFANRNEVSIFLAVCLPCFFRGKWHYGIIPILAGLIIAQTLNGLIGAVLVLAIYGLYLGVKKGYSKRVIIAATVVFMIASIGTYMRFIHGGGINSRLSAFTKASELVREKPLLGWGISQSQYVVPLYLNADRQKPQYLAYAYKRVIYKDDFKKVYLDNPIRHKTDDRMWIRLHNDYLQWTVDTGLAGLIGLLAIIASHAVSYIRTKRKDLILGLSLLCLLWSANAFFSFQIGRFAFITVFFLALVQGAYMKETTEG